MRILLACGMEGLLEYDGAWRILPCPLSCPTQLVTRSGAPIVADETGRLIWNGHALLPTDSGLEAIALWQNRLLTLSGDTDCLTLSDPETGQTQLVTPAGMYPQDLCLLPGGLAAVCGGADGSVRLIQLNDLVTVHAFHLPGETQRITYSGGELSVLCLIGEESVRCLLCRISLPGGGIREHCILPGLPGALCPDGSGGIWLASSEQLAHIPHRAHAPDLILHGFGLVRHMAYLGSSVLISDPVLGQCSLITPRGEKCLLHDGDVRQAVFAR